MMMDLNLGREKLRRRVMEMQERYLPWKISFSTCQDYFTHRGECFEYAQALPTDQANYEIWKLNDGIGPIPVPIEIMIGLDEEGKPADDLQDYLKPLLELNYRGLLPDKALPLLRILYRFFPQKLQGHRLEIARM